jgi:bla regulator protein blaR1
MIPPPGSKQPAADSWEAMNMSNSRARCLVAAVAALVGTAVLNPSRLDSQAPSQAAAFEVASVKPNNSGDNRVVFGMQPGGRFTSTNVPLKELIRMAYGVQTFQIDGGPDWIGSERFDIVAKAEGELRPSPPGGPPGPLLLMMQALLAERFKLVTHRDTRDLPIYALMLARSDGRLGPKLSASQVDCSTLPPPGARGSGPPAFPGPPALGERPRCGMFMGIGRIAAGGATMAQLATTLSQRVNRYVRDSTGLSGWYEFEIEFMPDQIPSPPPGAPPGAMPAPSPDAPSIFTALQEQLGLKLESQRGPVEVVVIDSVERPTPD